VLAELRGEDRRRALWILRWAQGLEPAGGPDPRELCGWLVDEVEAGGSPGGDPERGWRAACELVQIANGFAKPRPRPRLPVTREPVVQFAHSCLGEVPWKEE